jgi:hypothetical protein
MKNLFKILVVVSLFPFCVHAGAFGGAMQGLGQGLQEYGMMEAQRQATEQAYQQQLQAYQQQLQIERLKYLRALEERKKLEAQSLQSGGQ